MREYINNRGWTLTKEVEEVRSGAKTRPKREELLRRAKRREIDAILVWKLDRFGRSLADLVMTLNELREMGVVFVSLIESLELVRKVSSRLKSFKKNTYHSYLHHRHTCFS